MGQRNRRGSWYLFRKLELYLPTCGLGSSTKICFPGTSFQVFHLSSKGKAKTVLIYLKVLIS